MRLPDVPVSSESYPPVTGRESWQRELDALLVREKAHTRAGDALAAARRRLPMVAASPSAHVEGSNGAVPISDVFEGRRLLIAYYHMWHDGQPWEQQCEGSTFCASQIQSAEYLHSHDITLAIFCEGSYHESKPYADFLGYRLPWYSARDADDLSLGRHFGFYAFYVRNDDDEVFETYWSTDRGAEAALWSYALMDMTVFGRQESWEQSPPGWPRLAQDQHPWRIGGRPTIQWSVTDQPLIDDGPCHQ